MKKKLKLAWLFPSTLYLHGERGNILALKKIAAENEIDLTVDQIELNDNFNPLNYDIIYVPAGELNRAHSVINYLSTVKDGLKEFVEMGGPLIVTGNSISYFGDKIIRNNEEEIDGLKLIQATAIEKPEVYGDDLYFTTKYNNQDLEVFGNQIQMVDFELGEDDQPFGEIIYGYGNTGKDLTEGVQLNNSIFTNTLGPLLVLNPWLTKEILNIALTNNGFEPIKKELDFELEKKSLESKVRFTNNKKTKLKNIKR